MDMMIPDSGNAFAPAHSKPSTSQDPVAREIESRVVEQLRSCYDPEIPVNIFELGLIYDIRVTPQGEVHVMMTLTSPACPVATSLPPDVEARLRAIPGVTEARVEVTWDPPWGPDKMTEAAKLQLNML
ncbi:MAG TPA: iron-sulfur cluster assembly protein [Candidatus Polarisedimenticolia bacterium]|nr:iron-sulfur cluster assembly protein [Candidatus Polarisedimenticolia bacterium]